MAGSSSPRPELMLQLGNLTIDTPVVLAPMAGITNAAYRRLCAEQGAGLYVCAMITSRGLVEGDHHTKDMLVLAAQERGRNSARRLLRVGPALRHRRGVRRQGPRAAVREGGRPPHRPEVR